MMTPKERILASLTGNAVDRTPWCPFLAYFFESLPQAVQEKGQLAFMKEIGADPMLRGFHTLFKKSYKHTVIRENVSGRNKYVEYETPVGKLHAQYIFSPAGNTWFLQKHPVSSVEDFRILQYIQEDMVLTPDVKPFEEDKKMLGGDGLLIPMVASEGKSAFQSLLEYWVGTQELVYAVYDEPAIVEDCLAAIAVNNAKTLDISAESSAEAFIFWEDTSTTNLSPQLYEAYVLPEVTDWARRTHLSGKLLIQHACGHLRALVELMASAGIDSIESLSPPPTGDIELWEAFDKLPEHLSIIGGIEPTVFLNSTMDELEQYVSVLFKKTSGKRFILANSDSCPPGVAMEKFYLVTQLVRQYGVRTK